MNWRKIMPGNTLRGKLTLAVTSLTAVFILMTILVFAGVIKHKMKQAISNRQFDLATSLAEEIDDKIVTSLDRLSSIAHLVTPGMLAEQAQARQFLDQQSRTKALFDMGLYLLTPELAIFAKNQDACGCYDKSPALASLERVLKNKEPSVSDPFFLGENSQIPVLHFAVPVFTEEGQVGVVMVGLASLLNENFLGNLSKVRLGEEGYVHLFNQAGALIFTSDRTQSLNRDIPEGTDRMADRTLEGFEGSSETVNSGGGEGLGSIKKLSSTNWLLATNFPEVEAYAPLHNSLQILYPLSASLLLLAAIATWALMRHLTAPFDLLVNKFTAWHSTDPLEPIHFETGDELETLADTYNQMLTRLVQQQNQLKDDVRFLEDLLDVIPTPVYYKDVSGKYLGCNRAFEENIGIAKKDLIGKTVFNITPAELAPVYHQSDLHLFAKGPGETLTYEGTVQWHDGTLHDVIFYKATYAGSNGAPAGLIGTILDINDQKQAERALAWQKEFSEKILQNSAVPAFVLDADHKVLYWNKACEQFTGVPAADVLGTDRHWQGFYNHQRPCLADIVLSGNTADMSKYYNNFSRTTHVADGMQAEGWRVVNRQRRYLVFNAAPLRNNDGKVIASVQMLEDLTDRKRMEEELSEKNAELERFLYTVSHDLKSPVVTIKTFLGMFMTNLDQGDTELIRQDINYIDNATDKLNQQLNELLEMLRIGRVNSTPEHVSFRDVVEEALDYVAGAIKNNAVDVELENVSTTFWADRGQLVDIWQNLLENAVKYMGDQVAPRVQIGLENTENGPLFFVRDNGMGIAPQYHNRVFGLFEKLDPQSEGTGLGLAMVKRIVELYQGRIWTESAGAGQGACFRFTLPLAVDHD